MRARPIVPVLLAAVLAVAVVVAALLLHGDGGSPPRASPQSSVEDGDHEAGEAGRRRVDLPAPVDREPPSEGAPVSPELAAFRRALAAGDEGAAHEAATDLRRRVRTDEDAWQEAADLLLDETVATELRAALALVFGTVEHERTDEVLRALLDGSTGELARAAVLALGATREPPDDDEVFDLGDRPWGENGPGGLGITVRRTIEGAPTREALANVLRGGDTELRRVAAVALRHSMAFDDTREAFRTALRQEPDDAPLSEVAEAFAVRMRGAPQQAREVFLRDLVARAAEPGLDATRFRVIDDMHRVPLPRDVAARCRELALREHPFAVRAFGLDLLAAASTSGDADTIATARETLVRVLEGAVDTALRDSAARLLRQLPPAADSDAALLRSVREDDAWNVRYTALDTLARIESERLAEALAAAGEDDDERVLKLAAQLREER